MNKVKQNDRYAAYTINDLLSDRDFQDWIIDNNPEKERFWQDWIQQYPMKKPMLEEARRLLESIRFVEHKPSDITVEQSLNSTLAVMEEQATRLKPRYGNTIKLYSVLKVAAVVIGLVLTTVLLFYYNDRSGKEAAKVIASEYGKLKTVLLPDSTVVTLNANSELSVPNEWHEGAPREVWLKGEAFFNVKHLNKKGTTIAAYDRFIVQTPHLSVEVLGTSFDIRSRNNITEVVLKEGSVRVRFKDSAGRPDIVLKPGEMIHFDPASSIVKQKTVVAENYTAWTQKKLILDDPSLREIANYLEDIFGKKIEIDSKELAEKRMEGPVMLDNLDDALFVIAVTMNVEIIHTKDGLIFKSK